MLLIYDILLSKLSFHQEKLLCLRFGKLLNRRLQTKRNLIIQGLLEIYLPFSI